MAMERVFKRLEDGRRKGVGWGEPRIHVVNKECQFLPKLWVGNLKQKTQNEVDSFLYTHLREHFFNYFFICF